MVKLNKWYLNFQTLIIGVLLSAGSIHAASLNSNTPDEAAVDEAKLDVKLTEALVAWDLYDEYNAKIYLEKLENSEKIELLNMLQSQSMRKRDSGPWVF